MRKTNKQNMYRKKSKTKKHTRKQANKQASRQTSKQSNTSKQTHTQANKQRQSGHRTLSPSLSQFCWTVLGTDSLGADGSGTTPRG